MKDSDKTNEQLIDELIILRKRITELKSNCERVKEDWKSITENLPDYIMLLNQDANILFISHALPDLSREEVIGTSFYDYVLEEYRQVAKECFEHVLKTGELSNFESVYVDANGNSISFESYIGPVVRSGIVCGLTVRSTDVTESKKVNESLRKNEAKYRNLIESLSEGIWVIDKDAYTTFANPVMADMLGYTVEEMHGKHLFSFMDDGGIEISKRNLERRRQGIIEQHDFEFIRKDGSRIYTTLQASPVYNENKEYIGAIAGIIDITDRKMSEKALLESKEKLRRIIESSPVAITTTDLSGIIIECNPFAMNQYGVSTKEELIGKSSLDLIAPRDRQRAVENMKRVLEQDTVENLEYSMLTNDGHEYPAELSVSLIRDSSGNPISFIAILKDITERKQMAEMERLAAMGRMAVSIAHEINNPLAGIKNSFLLIKDAIPEDYPYYKYVGMIEKEINRIANIVRQMLNLYQTNQDPHEFFAEEVIQGVIMMLETKCRENAVIIKVDTSNAAVAITMQETMFPQILYNVILNAIEASPNGGTVEVTAIVDRNALTISVSDQGSGIPGEMRSRIFEPFFTTKTGGLGLGLSVTKSIVKLAGGSIDFENKPDKGVVFHITLPF